MLRIKNKFYLVLLLAITLTGLLYSEEMTNKKMLDKYGSEFLDKVTAQISAATFNVDELANFGWQAGKKAHVGKISQKELKNLYASRDALVEKLQGLKVSSENYLDVKMFIDFLNSSDFKGVFAIKSFYRHPFFKSITNAANSLMTAVRKMGGGGTAPSGIARYFADINSVSNPSSDKYQNFDLLKDIYSEALNNKKGQGGNMPADLKDKFGELDINKLRAKLVAMEKKIALQNLLTAIESYEADSAKNAVDNLNALNAKLKSDFDFTYKEAAKDINIKAKIGKDQKNWYVYIKLEEGAADKVNTAYKEKKAAIEAGEKEAADKAAKEKAEKERLAKEKEAADKAAAEEKARLEKEAAEKAKKEKEDKEKAEKEEKEKQKQAEEEKKKAEATTAQNQKFEEYKKLVEGCKKDQILENLKDFYQPPIFATKRSWITLGLTSFAEKQGLDKKLIEAVGKDNAENLFNMLVEMELAFAVDAMKNKISKKVSGIKGRGDYGDTEKTSITQASLNEVFAMGAESYSVVIGGGTSKPTVHINVKHGATNEEKKAVEKMQNALKDALRENKFNLIQLDDAKGDRGKFKEALRALFKEIISGWDKNEFKYLKFEKDDRLSNEFLTRLGQKIVEAGFKDLFKKDDFSDKSNREKLKHRLGLGSNNVFEPAKDKILSVFTDGI